MQNNKTVFRIRFIPWVVFFFGLVLTYGFQHAARQSAKQYIRGEFEFRVNEIFQNIDRRLHNYEQVLEGVAGLFQASSFVERKEFAEYVQTLRLEGKYPGIQGVGFSQWILSRDKARHIEKIRAAGFVQPPRASGVFFRLDRKGVADAKRIGSHGTSLTRHG